MRDGQIEIIYVEKHSVDFTLGLTRVHLARYREEEEARDFQGVELAKMLEHEVIEPARTK